MHSDRAYDIKEREGWHRSYTYREEKRKNRIMYNNNVQYPSNNH